MRLTTHKKSLFIVMMSFGVLLFGAQAQASTNETLAVGTVPYSELFGGPATMTMRRLTIAPGEVLGWHHHPGVGAYTIVKRGTLTVEDGCGGVQVYNAGDAFTEETNRVHRGKNLGTEPVETLQTFLVPQGMSISISTAKACGAPQTLSECQSNDWMNFTFPQTFANQGECVRFVIQEKRLDDCGRSGGDQDRKSP